MIEIHLIGSAISMLFIAPVIWWVVKLANCYCHFPEFGVYIIIQNCHLRSQHLVVSASVEQHSSSLLNLLFWLWIFSSNEFNLVSWMELEVREFVSALFVCIGDTGFTFGTVCWSSVRVGSNSVASRLGGGEISLDIACFVYVEVSLGTPVIWKEDRPFFTSSACLLNLRE